MSLMLGAGLVACAPVPVQRPAPGCAVGETAAVRETLYFGRNRPDGGIVGAADWQRFLDTEVTPRFPDGFTVVEARGQWRGRSGRVEQEPSALVILLHAGDAASTARVAAVSAAYRQRFRQEAVLRERSASCMRFES